MSDREIEGKEEEKQSEKGQGDWGAEKYRNDPLAGIVVALALIWAGVAWILVEVDVLVGMDIWSLALTGAGVIVILGVLVRLLVPAYRRPVGGSLVLGFILLGVGLGLSPLGWGIVGPLVLIAIALSIIVGVVTRKK